MRTSKRKPSHPGEILKELYLDAIGISITEFSKTLGVSRKAISAIVNERESITPEMAIRLSKAFDNTNPEFWLNIQRNYDLWFAQKEIEQEIKHIPCLSHSFA